MKQNVIFANYHEKTGETILVLQNKYGTFTAKAQVHEKDRDIQNRWDGFKFCEYKIRIKTLKAKYKKLMARLEGMQILEERWCDWSFYKERNEDCYCLEDFETAAFLFSQVRAAHKEAEEVKREYKALEEKYVELSEALLDERRKAREMKK